MRDFLLLFGLYRSRKHVVCLMLLVGVLFMILSLLGPLQASGASEGCDRTYSGDLVLEGNQVLEINGETICVYGNIVVKDNAKLVVTGTTVHMSVFNRNIWGNWANINAYDAASIEMRDVAFETPGGGVWITARDRSRVVLDRVRTTFGDGVSFTATGNSDVKIEGSTLIEFRIDDRATVCLYDSRVLWAVDLTFSGQSHVEIEDLTPGHYENWRTPQWEGTAFQLRLSDTDVGAWSVNVSDKAQVTIRDSVLDRLDILLDGASGEITGLRPGFFALWSLKNDNDISCPVELRLENTTLQGHWNLGFSNRAELTITDSDISQLGIWSTYVNLTIRQAQVAAFQAVNSMGNVVFDGVSITRGFEFENTILTMSGELVCSVNAWVANWQNSTIIREYSVRVEEEYASPAVGALVELESPSGQHLSKTTNEEGFVAFEIIFDDSNYSENWTLTVPTEERSATRSVGFLSSSPVNVRLYE